MSWCPIRSCPKLSEWGTGLQLVGITDPPFWRRLPFSGDTFRFAKPGRIVLPFRWPLLPDGKGFEMSARVWSSCRPKQIRLVWEWRVITLGDGWTSLPRLYYTILYRPGQFFFLFTRARENSTSPFFRHTRISVFIFYAVYCSSAKFTINKHRGNVIRFHTFIISAFSSICITLLLEDNRWNVFLLSRTWIDQVHQVRPTLIFYTYIL